MEPRFPRCDTCGALATRIVRDVRRTDKPGAQWAEWEHVGEPRAGCDEHPVYAMIHPREGESGNPIPFDSLRDPASTL